MRCLRLSARGSPPRCGVWSSTIASLALLGPVGPILTGIANAIGATITAVFEIILSLSKSAEGRVVLALVAVGLGFLYLRFHYIEEGKAMDIRAPSKKSCTRPARGGSDVSRSRMAAMSPSASPAK